MLGWLIYKEKDINRNQSYIEWFIHEGHKQHITIELIAHEQLTLGIEKGKKIILKDGKIVRLPDFVIVRTIEPLLQQFFEAKQVRSFNSYSVANMTNDKRLTYLEIAKLHIPIVPTYFYTKDTLPKEAPIPFPFVVKEATGRGGKQVYFVSNEIEWTDIKCKVTSEHIIVQDANVQLGKDLRVFIIGKQIIAAVLRENKHDFRANYSLGGSAQLYKLSATEEKMIQRIVEAFDFSLVGIDFLMSHRGELLFNEIEDVVGSRILSAVSEINLLEKFVTYIRQSLEKDKKSDGIDKCTLSNDCTNENDE